MATPKRCPAFSSGKHNWVHDGPTRKQDATGSRIPTGTHGRTCLNCKASEPDYPHCAVTVARSEGRWTSFNRCERRATVFRAERTSHVEYGMPPQEEYGYCAQHDPERIREKMRAAPPTQWERQSLRSALEYRVLREVERWDRDEAATEGFCADDVPCEHHECHLHRALLAYRAPLPATGAEARAASEAAWAKGREP